MKQDKEGKRRDKKEIKNVLFGVAGISNNFKDTFNVSLFLPQEIYTVVDKWLLVLSCASIIIFSKKIIKNDLLTSIS